MFHPTWTQTSAHEHNLCANLVCLPWMSEGKPHTKHFGGANGHWLQSCMQPIKEAGQYAINYTMCSIMLHISAEGESVTEILNGIYTTALIGSRGK